MVLARADPRPVRRAGPQALEGRPARPGRAARRPGPGPARRARRRPRVRRAGQRRRRRPGRLPARAGLVHQARGRGGRRRRAARDRLLLGGVRHHRRAAAVLRRPRHPGRRPPQGRLRPRRADRRGGPVLQDRLLQAVAVSREGWQQETYPVLDPDGLPLALLREADGTPCQVRVALPGGASSWRTSGRRRSGGFRCCCWTPTSRPTTRRPAASPTGSTAGPASTASSRRCCSASAASGRCGCGRG